MISFLKRRFSGTKLKLSELFNLSNISHIYTKKKIDVGCLMLVFRGQVRKKIQELKFAIATGEPNESRYISLLYQGIVFEAAYTFLKGRLKNLFFWQS